MVSEAFTAAANTLDISADLDELARTPVLVVCAGPKSVLDIDLTLEYLETRGVPVLGWQAWRWPVLRSRLGPGACRICRGRCRGLE